MEFKKPTYLGVKFSEFKRKLLEPSEEFNFLGSGSFGGKANGLAFIKNIIENNIDPSEFPQIEINIPRLTVIRSDYFQTFLKRNNLYEIAFSNISDERIAIAFQRADLPDEIVSDLRTLMSRVDSPLAIRSSSILEDDESEPFAGVYATKMIANNEEKIEDRLQKLIEAIKFVYASTFFKVAKDYMLASSHSLDEERMAVIIQEVVGERYNDRFYPEISGIARSFNYYPIGQTKPENGVVNLALGLGKAIVDDDITWCYSPKEPKAVPLFANPKNMLKNTQTEFWAVNMENNIQYDPINETEYLVKSNLSDAEYDGTLRLCASTYDSVSEKIVMGAGNDGPRVINFAPLLISNEFKYNLFIQRLLKFCEEAYKKPIEIEFAITFNEKDRKARFGFLQIRPMTASSEIVEITSEDLLSENALLASNNVMGNGIRNDILDVVFVKPEQFESEHTKIIANELELMNKKLFGDSKPYVIIGFGRWGSSDPWLGIPVEWGQIAGAKIIVESSLPGINVELSRGSHFFHNLNAFKVSYFSIHHEGLYFIDWDWLNDQELVSESRFVKHVTLKSPLMIKVDGRTGSGVILK